MERPGPAQIGDDGPHRRAADAPKRGEQESRSGKDREDICTSGQRHYGNEYRDSAAKVSGYDDNSAIKSIAKPAANQPEQNEGKQPQDEDSRQLLNPVCGLDCQPEKRDIEQACCKAGKKPSEKKDGKALPQARVYRTKCRKPDHPARS